MKSKKMNTPTFQRASLKKVLNKNEKIKEKVEQAATDLTSVNEVLKHGDKENPLFKTIKEAVVQNEAAEQMVTEAVEDLHEVNSELAKEVSERERIEAELALTRDDLSKSKINEEDTRKLVHQDVLTGLPDRTIFDQVLSDGLTHEKRHGPAFGFAVLFVDIDNFKQINDTYGHDLGDKVLRMVANRLQANVRKGDFVSRWGGDEFVCLLMGVRRKADMLHIAEKMVAQIAEDREWDGVILSVRISIGIAVYPKDGKTAETLFKNADKAMYKAKGAEKKVVLFE
jgi:diguanylate cyclase